MTEGDIHTSFPFLTTISHFGVTGTGSYPISMREPPAHYLALCEHLECDTLLKSTLALP